MSEDAVLRLAIALERLATVAENVFQRIYPEKEKREAVITRPDDEKRELYSDKAGPDWFDETEAATPEGKKSRFLDRLESTEAGDGESDAPAGSGAGASRSKPAKPRAVPKNKRTHA